MNDPVLYMIIAAASLIGISFLGVIGLKGFTGWLDLKRAELDAGRGVDQAIPPSAVNRIEIADLKERLRKLEAIAAGVDL